jgi:hypothetical protein
MVIIPFEFIALQDDLIFVSYLGENSASSVNNILYKDGPNMKSTKLLLLTIVSCIKAHLIHFGTQHGFYFMRPLIILIAIPRDIRHDEKLFGGPVHFKTNGVGSH